MSLFSKLFKRNNSRKAVIKQWILSVDSEQNMPDDIIALNFGLFEGPFSMYLIGSKTYDEDDSDWACDEDYIPAHKYCPPLGIPASTDWETVLEDLAGELKEIIAETPHLDLWRAEHITIGFDDGDFVCLK